MNESLTFLLDKQTLNLIADAIPHMVCTTDAQGHTTYLNRQCYDYTGVPFAEKNNEAWLKTIHPDDYAAFRGAWDHAIATGEDFQLEYRSRRKDGLYRWHLMRGVAHRDRSGQIALWICTSTDIDDQKQTEHSLRESEANVRALFETIPQLAWTTRPDGSMDYANQRWRDYIGLPPVKGTEWLNFVHPDDYAQVKAKRLSTLQTGLPFESEQRMRNGRTGEYRWFLVRALPVHDEYGQIIKWVGTCTDIDNRKLAEKALKESEENFRALAEAVPQFVWIARTVGYREYFNQRWYEYTQTAPEEVLGEGSWMQVVHPDDRERTRAAWKYASETGGVYEIEYRIKNGETSAYRWFLSRAIPVRDEHGTIIKWFGTTTDIDDQKRIEEDLRRTQQRANALMDSSIIGITITENRNIIEANDAFLAMTGYTRDDLSRRTVNWQKMTPPAYTHIDKQAYHDLMTYQRITPYETEFIGKDGSPIPILLGSVAFQEEPLQTIAFVLDISAQKELEQRKDDFISIASHELKTPLTALKAQLQLTKRRLLKQNTHDVIKQFSTADEQDAMAAVTQAGLQNALLTLLKADRQDGVATLSKLEAQVNKLAKLIDELLDVSKIRSGHLEFAQETVDIGELLQDTVETLQASLPTHTIALHNTTHVSLEGDRDRLGQVFINLISNAVKYSPKADHVDIHITASNEEVTISVRDYGIGIPCEHRDKVFERFYRTPGSDKKAFPGLGMGLYISAGIIRRHNGTISVSSQMGEGSTFTVTLPLAKDTLVCS